MGVCFSPRTSKASIVTVDSGFHDVSSINLEGHAHLVHDILPLPSSSQCVTCSDDKTSKVSTIHAFSGVQYYA